MGEEKSTLTVTQKMDAVKLFIQALEASSGAVRQGQSGAELADVIIEGTEKLGKYLFSK